MLLQAIRNHDRPRCRVVMSDHLTDAEKFLDQMADRKLAPPKT